MNWKQESGNLKKNENEARKKQERTNELNDIKEKLLGRKV